MSERTHSTKFARLGPTQRLTIVIAGTAVLLLLAGVLFQVLRAQPTQAQTRPAQAPSRQGPANAPVADNRPMATVNDEVISYDEVASECVAVYGKDILESLINRTIIQQACQRANLQVSAEEVHGEVARIASRFNLDVNDWYKLLEAERGVMPAQYQRDIIWPMLALRKLAGADVTISPEELKEAYIRDFGPRVKAKMIMFDRLEHAKKVWQQASKDPQEFGRLARMHSVEPNSKALDGQIPPIRRFAGEEKIWKEAFKLQEGEVSGILQVGLNQYVILFCEGFTTPIDVEYSTVEKDLQERILEEKRQEAVARIFEKLKQEATITNYLTRERKEGVQQSSGSTTSGRTNAAASQVDAELRNPGTSSTPRQTAPAGAGRARSTNR